MEKAMDDEQVKSMLVFLPTRLSAPPKQERAPPAPQGERPKKAPRNNKQKGNGKGGGGGKKGGGKGGGSKNKPGGPLPGEMKGLNATHHGKKICFDFNLGGCGASCSGDPPMCSKGFVHVCARCGSLSHGQRSSKCTQKA
jgi:hypothetical protein